MSTTTPPAVVDTLVIYDSDNYSQICASLLVEEKSKSTLRVPIFRNENLEKVLEEKVLEEKVLEEKVFKVLAGPPNTIIAMVIIADTGYEMIVEKFPLSKIHLILSEKKEIKNENVVQHIGSGPEIYDQIEEILGLEIRRLGLLLYFISKRTTSDKSEDADNITFFIYNNLPKGTHEEQIKAALKYSVNHVREEGKKSRLEFIRDIRENVEAGSLIDLSFDGKDDREAWLFKHERGVTDALKYSAKNLSGVAKIHICMYTKDKPNRIYFTIWSTDENISAKEIASTWGGGGTHECAEWNLPKEDADKWVEKTKVKIEE